MSAGCFEEVPRGQWRCLAPALTPDLPLQVNQRLPDRIVVFRDGVGDGQMATVAEYEVPQMTSCFAMFGEDYSPKMAVVVVQKRISTRVFLQAGRGGLSNPPPGTVVDHTITRRGW